MRYLLIFLLMLTPAAPAETTLYQRLGGYDAIFAVTDDFLSKLVVHPKTAKYFVGSSTDTRKKIRQHVVDFIADNTGGPTLYQGRSMRVSHRGLGITPEEWKVAVELMVETLQKFKVPKPEADELLSLIGSLQEDIVELPKRGEPGIWDNKK